MAATVLNSPRAVEMSLFVIRAFVRLRHVLASNEQLRRKIDVMAKKYDHQFAVVFDAIRQLMTEPQTLPKPRIGFSTEGGK